MNSKHKRTVATLTVVAALAIALTGCQSPKDPGSKPHRTGGLTDNDVYPYEDGKVDHYPTYVLGKSGGPSPSEGWLTIPMSSFGSGNNGQACFPANQGWNRYYVTFYFLGPNVNPPPNPNTYANAENNNSITIDTMLPENGTTLDTGIVILENLDPTKKVCNDDGVYPPNSKLSKATFSPTLPGKKYRVGIFYKSASDPAITSVKFHWSYP